MRHFQISIRKIDGEPGLNPLIQTNLLHTFRKSDEQMFKQTETKFFN